jgi:predicted DNA-binding antitoxin AbrB/MazE fold protein
MSQRLKAIYREGAFIPQMPCDLPEGAEVEITIHEANLLPPEVTDPEDRKRIMSELIQNMLDNPIPANAPRFTREELHERR